MEERLTGDLTKTLDLADVPESLTYRNDDKSDR